MKSRGIQPPDEDHLFDLANPFGPKTKVLQEILRRQQNPALSNPESTLHFVEDRWYLRFTYRVPFFVFSVIFFWYPVATRLIC